MITKATDYLIYLGSRVWAAMLLGVVVITGLRGFNRLEGCYFCKSHGPEHLIGCTYRALVAYVVSGTYEQTKRVR